MDSSSVIGELCQGGNTHPVFHTPPPSQPIKRCPFSSITDTPGTCKSAARGLISSRHVSGAACHLPSSGRRVGEHQLKLCWPDAFKKICKKGEGKKQQKKKQPTTSLRCQGSTVSDVWYTLTCESHYYSSCQDYTHKWADDVSRAEVSW